MLVADRVGPPPSGYAAARPDQTQFNLTGLNSGKMSASAISAPTSPARSTGGSSMYSQVQGLTRGIFQAATGTPRQPSLSSANTRVLLVIDAPTTDWSKYFRGARIGDWELAVEQAEWAELKIVADSRAGASATLTSCRSGAPLTKTFRPDFVLVRQPVKSSTTDYRRLIVALLLAGVPALNSLHSIYNFIDKPWVFAHLLMLQKRLGRDKFPLIDQVYYPSTHDLELTGSLPAVVKMGWGQRGEGKMRVTEATALGDVGSLVGAAGQPCTLEPFVDAKYDIHVQKIGSHYKAFMRKGISGHWKANQGSSMLEQIAMTERYRVWVDEVATLFGGLEVVSVEGLVGRDGSEWIYEANDSSFALLGETQEEDRRQIADLALAKMTAVLTARANAANGPTRRVSGSESGGGISNFIKHDAPAYSNSSSPAPPARPTPLANGSGSGASTPQHTNPFLGGGTNPPAQPPPPPMPPRGPPPPRPKRQPSLPRTDAPPPPQPTSPASSDASSVASRPSQPPPQPPPGHPPGQSQEDTMGQLRKTFAGIFGDM